MCTLEGMEIDFDMKKVKIVFFMMAYNTEKYVERAIRSILNQSLEEIALVVRNNGSTDSTGEIIRRIAREDNRIIVLENHINCIPDDGNKMYDYFWWGNSLTEIDAEYFTIVDSDDYIESDFAEKMYSKAKSTDVDITVCGNWFVDEDGRKCSNRVPGRFEKATIDSLGDEFPQIYNCFRTWWGKLFKKEFFNSNYDNAWTWERPMFWIMDTVVMLNYLNLADSISTVDEPLYCMTVRSGSTYSTRPFDEGVLWSAYALNRLSARILRKYRIDSDSNLDFLKDVHWIYITEAMERFNNPETSYREILNKLLIIFNDKAVGESCSDKFELMYGGIERYLELAEKRAGEDLSIYDNYLMRLKCFVDLVKEDDNNPLNYFILISAIFDKNNHHQFGWKFIELPLRGGSQGVKVHSHAGEEPWGYWAGDHECYVKRFCAAYDDTPETRALGAQVVDLWNNKQYDDCEEKAYELLGLASMNRKAILYIMRVAYIKGFIELATILAYSARVVFDYDNEVQECCYRILNSLEIE